MKDAGDRGAAPARWGKAGSAAQVEWALASVTRVRIVQLLEEGPADVATIAAGTGLHYNTVRNHLGVLALAGLVTRAQTPSGRPGRPPVVYQLADPPPRASSWDRRADRVLLETLTAALREAADDPGGAAARAAEPVGRARAHGGPPPASVVEALERVTRLLEDLGFAPRLELDGDAARVLLRRCPFDDLAVRYGDIVCAAHLGILRGALAELGATVETDLRPFVEANLCVADVRIPRDRGGLPLSSS